MIARIWRTQVVSTRLVEFEQFERDQSLPMFLQQRGFRGVLFLSGQPDCLVLSLWEDQLAIDALATSATYQATVQRLHDTGLLLGQPQVELYEIAGGALLPTALS